MTYRKPSTTVYFDGLCPLCSREIAHYRKKKGSEKIVFIDITSSEFSAKAEGLDPIKIHREMHVRRKDGKLAVGVDGFISIWEELPDFHWAARLAKLRGIHFCMRVGYKIFAKIRPYLPRKKADCSRSPYCETKNSLSPK